MQKETGTRLNRGWKQEVREQLLCCSGKGPCDAAGRARAGSGRWPLVLRWRDDPGLPGLAAKPLGLCCKRSPSPRRRDPQAPAPSTLMK